MRIDDRRQTDWNYDTSLGRSAPPAPRDGSPSVRLELLPDSAATRHETPELLAFFANVRAQAAGTTATDAVSASAAESAREKQVQAKLDTLRDQYSGPYTVAGKQVPARPMFRMNGGMNEKKLTKHDAELTAVCARVGVDKWSVTHGCASPEQLRKVTQALVDKYLLDTNDPAKDIRELQWEFGLGIDCACFTYRALEAVTGKAGARLGLKGLGAEGFRGMDSDPEKRGKFTKVEPKAVRAGDLITLDGPNGSTGHNVMVRGRRVLDDREKRALENERGAAATQFFAGSGPFHAIQVDSSWGTGDRPQDYGGYRSDTWLYDEGSRRWASVEPSSGQLVISDVGPSGDLFHGGYRVNGGA